MVQLFSLIPSALMPAYFLKLRFTGLSGDRDSSLASQASFLSSSSSIAWTVGLALLSVYFLIDKSLINFLFGEEFAGSITATRIFLISSIFDSVSGFYQTFYLASELSSVYLLAQLLPNLIIVLIFVSSISLFGLKTFGIETVEFFVASCCLYVQSSKNLTNSLGNIFISLALCFAS